ncbi:MAG: DEAD/DEAH box helicase [Fimbriimonas sp.]
MINQFTPHEEAFADWKRDGYQGVKTETFKLIDWLTDPENDQQPRAGTLWPHQWDAFLKVVYCYEVLGPKALGGKGLLLNIVTGGGKTAIMGAVMAWLRLAHDLRRFVIICPNLIVRDRLTSDFEKGKVFKDRDFLPPGMGVSAEDFHLTTLGSSGGGGYMNLLSSSVILGNIHQFYSSNKSGQSNLAAMLEGEDFAIFNDEAHNSAAEEYETTLRRLEPKTRLRLDLTATPDRADGQVPTTRMITEYGIADALADSVIKTPVVYQPSISQIELTYTDARTGEKKKFEEINWEEVDRLGLSATQWVTDDEPMRQQMAIAIKRIQEQEARAKGRYQPILFVVAVCKADALKATETLNRFFGVRTLMVTEDSDEDDRKKAQELGKEKSTKNPYRAVVSVLMLREGWDVPEVGVILLLRKFSSRVYGQQVIGRGLRRVRVKGVTAEEPQICAVVDHPKLEHKWLWDLFGVKPRENVLIDDIFDENVDLPEPPPKQELIKPQNTIEVPDEDPSFIDDRPFELTGTYEVPDPVQDFEEVIKAFAYDDTATEITKVKIDSVKGQELAGDRFTEYSSAPEVGDGPSVQIPSDTLREGIKDRLLEMAEKLTIDAGYATAFNGKVYSVVLQHVRTRFLKNSIGLADRPELLYAWKMLDQVERNFRSVPGLIAGVIEYGS